MVMDRPTHDGKQLPPRRWTRDEAKDTAQSWSQWRTPTIDDLV